MTMLAELQEFGICDRSISEKGKCLAVSLDGTPCYATSNLEAAFPCPELRV